MFSYCLSFFKSNSKPGAKNEVKTAFLELPPRNYLNDNLSMLEEKLTYISECSKKYLQQKNCLIITLDAVLSALSGASSTGLGFLIYNSQPSQKLIECLNLLNTTITDYCQNDNPSQCDGVDDEYCNHNLTAVILAPSAFLLFCAAGICLAHEKLKENINWKHMAFDEHQLKSQLNEDDKKLLSRYNIRGNSSEMLQQIQNLSNSFGVQLENRPLSPRS